MKYIAMILLVTLFILGCAEETPIIKKFPSFVTKDLNGREFSNVIFTGADVTAVIILKLDSQVCIKLLSDLNKLNDKIDNTQIILLIVEKNIDKHIIDITNNFVTLIVNDDFNDLLLNIHSVPTTIFVDGSGNIMGQSVIGDNIELIRREILRLLEMNSSDYKDLKFIQDKIF